LPLVSSFAFLLFCKEMGFFPVIRGPLWLSPTKAMREKLEKGGVRHTHRHRWEEKGRGGGGSCGGALVWSRRCEGGSGSGSEGEGWCDGLRGVGGEGSVQTTQMTHGGGRRGRRRRDIGFRVCVGENGRDGASGGSVRKERGRTRGVAGADARERTGMADSAATDPRRW
jgi:hypothetical protein